MDASIVYIETFQTSEVALSREVVVSLTKVKTAGCISSDVVMLDRLLLTPLNLTNKSLIRASCLINQEFRFVLFSCSSRTRKRDASSNIR